MVSQMGFCHLAVSAHQSCQPVPQMLQPLQTFLPVQMSPRSQLLLFVYWLKKMVKELRGVSDLLLYLECRGKGECMGYEGIVEDQSKYELSI